MLARLLENLPGRKRKCNPHYRSDKIEMEIKTTQKNCPSAKPERTEFQSESKLEPEKEIIQIRNNYRKEQKLWLFLKHDETIRDYMNLEYMLQTSEKAVDFNTLIFWLQTNFHTVITSYFNTLSIPEEETRTINLKHVI